MKGLVIIYFSQIQKKEGDFCENFCANRMYGRFLRIFVKMNKYLAFRFRICNRILFRVYLLVIVDCCSLLSVGCRVLTADCVGCYCLSLLFFPGCRVSSRLSGVGR
jgi:hypothetical protein